MKKTKSKKKGVVIANEDQPLQLQTDNLMDPVAFQHNASAIAAAAPRIHNLVLAGKMDARTGGVLNNTIRSSERLCVDLPMKLAKLAMQAKKLNMSPPKFLP
jgi:hypothetical protein